MSMTEQDLNGAEIHSGFQQVSGKGTMPLPGLCREDQNEAVQSPQNTGLLA
jgi:hypothetical protein